MGQRSQIYVRYSSCNQEDVNAVRQMVHEFCQLVHVKESDFVVKEEKIRYFEVEFDNEVRSRECGDDAVGFYSICIRAMRKPSHEEAEEFCKSDIEAMGYKHVVAVREIDAYEAHQFFDEDEEEKYPVFR